MPKAPDPTGQSLCVRAVSCAVRLPKSCARQCTGSSLKELVDNFHGRPFLLQAGTDRIPVDLPPLATHIFLFIWYINNCIKTEQPTDRKCVRLVEQVVRRCEQLFDTAVQKDEVRNSGARTANPAALNFCTQQRVEHGQLERGSR